MLEIKELKIFQIEDGEQHHVVAKTKEEAINYFLDEINFDDLQECDLEVREISQDEDIQVNITEDDFLVKLINQYKNQYQNEKETYIDIWLYLKYSIVEKELQGNVLEVPFVICSSIFN